MNDTTNPVTPAPAAPAPAAPAPAPAAPAPAAPEQVEGGLSAAEQDYFKSRGEKTDGLLAEQLAPGAAPAPGTGAAPAATPAPGAPPAPAAAGEDDDSDDDLPHDPAKPPPKRVNYNKFKRVMERAKNLEKQLNEQTIKAATDHATLAERVRLINEALSTPAQQQQQEEEDPEPDPQVDIFQHNAWLARKAAKLETRLATYDKRENERASQQSLQDTYTADAESFQSTPTLEDGSPNLAGQLVALPDGRQVTNFAVAYFYLINNRMEELKRFGMKDMGEIKRTVANEEKDLVRRALKEGVSPARRVWDMALGRGYQPIIAASQPATNGAAAPASAPAAAAPGAPGTPLGGPAAAAPATNGAAPAAGAPSVSEEIAKIKNGQGAAFSLSNAAGAAGDTLTPQAIADMPIEDFRALLARLPKSRQRELLGN